MKFELGAQQWAIIFNTYKTNRFGGGGGHKDMLEQLLLTRPLRSNRSPLINLFQLLQSIFHSNKTLVKVFFCTKVHAHRLGIHHDISNQHQSSCSLENSAYDLRLCIKAHKRQAESI